MYKKILVPLDGSKLAECALPHAESLAQKYGATLVLMSVISPASLTGRSPADMQIFQESLDTRREEAQAYLKGLAGEFAEKNIKSEAHVGIEPVVERSSKRRIDTMSISFLLPVMAAVASSVCFSAASLQVC
jgi:nucleotide-binding universal stress UspA family protein